MKPSQLLEFSQAPWLALGCVALLGGALFFWALRTYQRHRAALSNASTDPAEQQRARRFNVINAAQWVAIFVVAGALSYLGRADYILPAIIAIVGLHFLPLGRLFAYPPHYLTGVAMVAWALIYSLMPGMGPRSTWGPFGAGALLWLSAAWALKRR